MLERRVDQGTDLALIRDVSLVGQRTAAELLECRDDLGRRGGVGVIVHDDVGALLSERERDRAAEPAARPRDQRHPTVETSHRGAHLRVRRAAMQAVALDADPLRSVRRPSTTQIDAALRLSWCTDVQPGPTQYPKHGSQGAAPIGAGRRRDRRLDHRHVLR